MLQLLPVFALLASLDGQFHRHESSASNISSAFSGPIFEVDMLMNDIDKGWEQEGFPEYLRKRAATYTVSTSITVSTTQSYFRGECAYFLAVDICLFPRTSLA